MLKVSFVLFSVLLATFFTSYLLGSFLLDLGIHFFIAALSSMLLGFFMPPLLYNWIMR